MSAIEPTQPPFDDAYRRIKAILTEARDRAWQAVNTAMVAAYWEVGRVIVEDEQAGQQRADYGKRVLDRSSPSASRRNSARASTRPTSPHAGVLPDLPDS